MIYLNIFLCYFQIGLLSVGGGYASVPVIRAMVVEGRGWLTELEFLDMMMIAETTPGPFALNSATFVGMKLAGLAGGALATFACMLPSLLIIILLAVIYQKYKNLRLVNGALAGVRPAVAALIAGAAISIMLLAMFGTNVIGEIKSFDIPALVLAAAVFILIRWKKYNPPLMILCSGAAGLIIYSMINFLTGKGV